MKTLKIEGHDVYIDSEDFDLVNGFNWFIKEVGNARYVRANHGHMNIMMHRLIAGEPEGGNTIKHINGNGLDNRKNNLLNTCGRRVYGQTGSSKYRGVHLSETEGSWRASLYIPKGQKTRFLGRYHSEFEAALAYDKAAFEQFGEFARLNFEGSDALS